MLWKTLLLTSAMSISCNSPAQQSVDAKVANGQDAFIVQDADASFACTPPIPVCDERTEERIPLASLECTLAHTTHYPVRKIATLPQGIAWAEVDVPYAKITWEKVHVHHNGCVQEVATFGPDRRGYSSIRGFESAGSKLVFGVQESTSRTYLYDSQTGDLTQTPLEDFIVFDGRRIITHKHYSVLDETAERFIVYDIETGEMAEKCNAPSTMSESDHYLNLPATPWGFLKEFFTLAGNKLYYVLYNRNIGEPFAIEECDLETGKIKRILEDRLNEIKASEHILAYITPIDDHSNYGILKLWDLAQEQYILLPKPHPPSVLVDSGLLFAQHRLYVRACETVLLGEATLCIGETNATQMAGYALDLVSLLFEQVTPVPQIMELKTRNRSMTYPLFDAKDAIAYVQRDALSPPPVAEETNNIHLCQLKEK